MKRLVYSGLFFFAIVLLSSCVKRELELYEGKFVRIDFNWSHLADRQNMPDKLVIRFYSRAGDFLFERTSAPNRFEGYIPEGNYKILVYNPDDTNVRYRNMESFEDAGITVSSENTSNVYGGTYGNLTVPSVEDANPVVVLYPCLHQISMKLNITGNGKDDVVECMAVINGTAEGVNLSTGLPITGTNSSVSGKLYPDKGHYYGTFYLAGSDKEYPSVISFKIRFQDGTERIIQQNFEDFMKYLEERPADTPLFVEFTIDVQSIDGILTAVVKNWIYKKGEITLN